MSLARALAGVGCLCLAIPGASSPNEFWAPVDPPRATYDVFVSYSADTQRLQGTQTVRFRNDTARPIDRVAFRWFGEITSVRSNGAVASRPPGQYAQHVFDLPQPLRPGGEIELAVEFVADWPLDSRNSGRITSFLSPKLWWGFGTHDDYTVGLRVPEGYAFATSGRLDPATGLHVAVGARSFGLFIGKGYDTAEADAGGVLVRAVFTPRGRPCAELLLRSAVDAIGFYRQRFGFYPHTQLSIVPGAAEPSGGYPAATGLVAIHGQERVTEWDEQAWRRITAHEIGHQYWMEHVLAEGDEPLPWLMLGLGIHADREYRRARGMTTGGPETAYRLGVTDGRDTTMDLTEEQREAATWNVNNIVDHGKSAALLNALEAVLGIDTFDAVYRRCLREFAGRRLGWREFQRVAEAETGQDLGWFFEQWVRSSKTANYHVTDSTCSGTASGHTCTVTVQALGRMRMPVSVLARFADGSEQRARTDRLADVDVLTFRARAPLMDVVIEPESAIVLIAAP
jgi:hypothetical protein